MTNRNRIEKQQEDQEACQSERQFGVSMTCLPEGHDTSNWKRDCFLITESDIYIFF